jgi:hypothetical protein
MAVCGKQFENFHTQQCLHRWEPGQIWPVGVENNTNLHRWEPSLGYRGLRRYARRVLKAWLAVERGGAGWRWPWRRSLEVERGEGAAAQFRWPEAPPSLGFRAAWVWAGSRLRRDFSWQEAGLVWDRWDGWFKCPFFYRELTVFFSFFEGECLFFLTSEFKGYVKKKRSFCIFLVTLHSIFFAYYVWSSQTLLNLINYTKKCQYIWYQRHIIRKYISWYL